MRLWKLIVAVALVVATGAAYASLASGQTTPTCNDNWANSSVTSGDWATSSNWTNGVPGTQPGVNDVACWPSTVTVTVSTGTQTALAVEGGTLTVDGGSLAITDSSDDSTLAALNISGGALTGDSPVTLSGDFDWSGQATLGGSGSSGIDITQTAGTFSISGSGQNYYQGGSINTSSPVSITDTGTNGFIGTNNPTLTTTSTVTFAQGAFGGSVTIEAAGFITANTGATTTSYNLDATGSSSDLAGSLSAGGFSSESGSSLTIPSGVTLTSSNGGTINGTITGTGTFDIGGSTDVKSGATLSSGVTAAGGTVTIDSGATYSAAATTVSGADVILNNASASTGDLTISGGQLNGASAFSVTGDFLWDGGSSVGNSTPVNITQSGTGTFTISGSGQEYFQGGSISTASPVSITNTNSNGFISTNSPTLTTTSTVTFAQGGPFGSGDMTIKAAGFITSNTGSTATPGYTLDLTGSSSDLAGSLDAQGFSSESAGSLTIPTGVTLTSDYGGTISGTIEGAGTFDTGGGTTEVKSGATLSSQVDAAGGTVTIDSGATYSAGGTTVAGGTLNITPTTATTADLSETGGILNGPGDLGVTGNFSWTGGEIGNAAAIAITQTGSGSFSVSGSAQAYFLGGSIDTSSPVSITSTDFTPANSPTLTTTSAVTFGSGFNGSGDVTISAAGFDISGNTNADYSLAQTGGTTDIPSGTDLSASSFGVSGGTLTVDGTIGSKQATPVTMTGGTLTGTGTLDGSLDQTGGTLSPGDAPGVLTLADGYTQSANGTLAIEVTSATIGGASALNVTGSISLAGTLLMEPSDSYAASASQGDEFDLIDFTGTQTGSFTAITSRPQLHEGETFAEKDTAGTVEAIVGAPQPPQSAGAPVVSGTALVGDQLSTTNGSWNNDPSSFTYQWEDCTSAAAISCTNVASDGTSSTYTLTSGDLGKYVTVIVTAHNAAANAGTATGTPVKGPVTAPAPPPTGKPVNTDPPTITGTPASGKTLTCSTGTWSPTATKYTYAWSADGTPIIGATTSTYTIQQTDEGLTITCTVTASNTSGSSSPAMSAGLPIPVPVVKNCPKATGTLGGTTLGLIHLGMTRKQARHAFTKSSTRGQAYIDYFCLTPRGVRAGYASPKLLKTLPKSKRTALSGRVIWASTSNGYYSVRGIRPGATLTATKTALPHGNYFRVGANYWYLAPNGTDTAVLKLRGGVVQEIGIGNKALTNGLKAQKIFMTSFE